MRVVRRTNSRVPESTQAPRSTCPASGADGSPRALDVRRGGPRLRAARLRPSRPGQPRHVLAQGHRRCTKGPSRPLRCEPRACAQPTLESVAMTRPRIDRRERLTTDHDQHQRPRNPGRRRVTVVPMLPHGEGASRTTSRPTPKYQCWRALLPWLRSRPQRVGLAFVPSCVCLRHVGGRDEFWPDSRSKL